MNGFSPQENRDVEWCLQKGGVMVSVKFRISFLAAVLLALLSLPALAELQKAHIDKQEGYSIRMPSRWESQPLPPPKDYEALGMKKPSAEMLEKQEIVPLLIFKGPQGEEFRLFRMKADDLEGAKKPALKFASTRNYGRTKEEEKFKYRSSKTKGIYLKYSSKGWRTQWNIYHFIAVNNNGSFLLTYSYDSQKKSTKDRIFESAKSFSFVKKKAPKKKTHLDERIDLPPGWHLLETSNYYIQYNVKQKDKVVDFGNKIERLTKAHRKVLPRKPEIEKLRPKKQRKKFVIKYFKDYGAFQGYAGDQGVFGAAAYYSPSQGEIAFYLSGWKKRTMCILYHECTHQYLQEFVGGPRVGFHIWINEGLAEYFFAAGSGDPNKVVPGHDYSEASQTIKSAIRSGTPRAIIPLAKLIRMSQREYYRNGRFAYNHGWALVHFLLNSKNKTYNQVIYKYFYYIQKTCFPILSAIAEKGVDVNKGNANVNGGGGGEKDLDDIPEGIIDVKKLRTAQNDALEVAFQGINMDQLQKDWEDYFR